MRASTTSAAVVAGVTGLGLAFVLARPLNRIVLGFFVRFYAEMVAAALCGHAVAEIPPPDEGTPTRP